jgi:hypothetical protein
MKVFAVRFSNLAALFTISISDFERKRTSFVGPFLDAVLGALCMLRTVVSRYWSVKNFFQNSLSPVILWMRGAS